MKSARQIGRQLLGGILRVFHAPDWWIESRPKEGADDARHGKVVAGGRLFPRLVMNPDTGRRELDPEARSWNPETWGPEDIEPIIRASIKHRLPSREVRIILRVRWFEVGWKSVTHWIDVLTDPAALAVDLHEKLSEAWHEYGSRGFDRMSAVVSLLTKTEVEKKREKAKPKTKRKNTRKVAKGKKRKRVERGGKKQNRKRRKTSSARKGARKAKSVRSRRDRAPTSKGNKQPRKANHKTRKKTRGRR